MSSKAHYRKINDGTGASSTYHKKDGTCVKAKLKEETRKEVKLFNSEKEKTQ